MNNFIINESIQWSLDGFETKLNGNTLITGTPGSGKSTLEGYNILSLDEINHIIVDPKGDMYKIKDQLEKKGYEIQLFDLITPECSMQYNPMSYIREDHAEEDIFMLANTLYGQKYSKDPFWDDTAIAFLCALIAYVYTMCEKENRNLKAVMDLLNSIQMSIRSDEGAELNIDILFKQVEEQYGRDHIAVKMYRSARVDAFKTQSTIMASLNARLAPFKVNTILEMLSGDEICLNQIGRNKKTALFIVLKDYDYSLHPICKLFLKQIIQKFYQIADESELGRLPIPTMFWLDDFGSYSISDFDAIISTARSRNIHFTLIFQSLRQLSKNYGDLLSETIIQCADTWVYFGGNDYKTIKYLSEITGWTTNYISKLKRFEAILYRRNEDVVKVKTIDFEKETEKCIWNYKRVQRKRINRPTKQEVRLFDYDWCIVDQLETRIKKCDYIEMEENAVWGKVKIDFDSEEAGLLRSIYLNDKDIFDEINYLLHPEDFPDLYTLMDYVPRFLQKENYPMIIDEGDLQKFVELINEYIEQIAYEFEMAVEAGLVKPA